MCVAQSLFLRRSEDCEDNIEEQFKCVKYKNDLKEDHMCKQIALAVMHVWVRFIGVWGFWCFSCN